MKLVLRSALAVGVVSVLVGCATSAPCAGTAAPARAGAADATDTLALRDVEVTFHDAGSTKDLDRMMSLFADDAVLVVGDKSYVGKDQVRHYFADLAAPFRPENQLIGYTPAQRIRTTVNGDTATLYFECLWVDAKGEKPSLHTFSDDTLVRSGGKWIIKTMKAGSVPGI